MSAPIQQSYEMKATPAQVFEALTNPEIIQKWSGAPATMDDQVGTNFSLFGGGIVGKNLEVAPNQKLVQEWKASDWDRSSKVAFTLVPTADGTRVELFHENVPDAAYETISQGWGPRYLGQIQKMFAAS